MKLPERTNLKGVSPSKSVNPVVHQPEPEPEQQTTQEETTSMEEVLVQLSNSAIYRAKVLEMEQEKLNELRSLNMILQDIRKVLASKEGFEDDDDEEEIEPEDD